MYFIFQAVALLQRILQNPNLVDISSVFSLEALDLNEYRNYNFNFQGVSRCMLLYLQSVSQLLMDKLYKRAQNKLAHQFETKPFNDLPYLQSIMFEEVLVDFCYLCSCVLWLYSLQAKKMLANVLVHAPLDDVPLSPGSTTTYNEMQLTPKPQLPVQKPSDGR